MKFLALLFLVGCATANFYDALEDEAELLYQEFMLGLEDSGSLKEALGHQLLQQAEDDVKTELGKRLRETLNEILEKMKESVDKGKVISEELQEKMKEIREKMKEMKIELGKKTKELLEKVKDKVQQFWKDILDKLKPNDEKRSVQDADWNIKDLFRKLKESLLEKINKEKLKAKVEELFGKGSEMADSLLKLINEKGDKYKEKLFDLIDRYLGKEKKKRSISEVWEKIKDYFKNLQIDLKEKYMKFGDWVKKTFKDGLDKGKGKIENIKNIAKEFLDHTKGVSKDVAAEALEFMRPYKEDLGALWDQLKIAVKDIMNQKE